MTASNQSNRKSNQVQKRFHRKSNLSSGYWDGGSDWPSTPTPPNWKGQRWLNVNMGERTPTALTLLQGVCSGRNPMGHPRECTNSAVPTVLTFMNVHGTMAGWQGYSGKLALLLLPCSWSSSKCYNGPNREEKKQISPMILVALY